MTTAAAKEDENPFPRAAPRVAEIFARMSSVMQEIEAVAKGRKNLQQGYSFRGIDEVYNALHGPLAKHGVFYVPEVLERECVERTSKNGGVLFYVTVKAEFTFYAPDGSSVKAVTFGEAMDSADKATNKAMSAALKYCLMQTFCIPTEDAEDADANTPEVAPRGNGQPKPAESPKVDPAATAPRAVAETPPPGEWATADQIAELAAIGKAYGFTKPAEVREWCEKELKRLLAGADGKPSLRAMKAEECSRMILALGIAEEQKRAGGAA